MTKKILASLDTNDPDTMQEVDIAMTHAIELQREKVLEQFFELPDVTMKSVDMLRLYTKPDKSKFLSSNRLLQDRLRQMSYEKVVFKADTHALYQRALSRFFRGVNPVLQQELKLCDRTRVTAFRTRDRNDLLTPYLPLAGEPTTYSTGCSCTGVTLYIHTHPLTLTSFFARPHSNEIMARDVWPKCENPIVSHSGIEPLDPRKSLLPTHVLSLTLDSTLPSSAWPSVIRWLRWPSSRTPPQRSELRPCRHGPSAR